MLRDDVIVYDDGTPRTKHVTTNLAIEIDEEAGTAVSRAYFTALQALPELAPQRIVSGRYHDRFERREGLWRFVERRVRTDLVGDLSRHLRSSPHSSSPLPASAALDLVTREFLSMRNSAHPLSRRKNICPARTNHGSPNSTRSIPRSSCATSPARPTSVPDRYRALVLKVSLAEPTPSPHDAQASAQRLKKGRARPELDGSQEPLWRLQPGALPRGSTVARLPVWSYCEPACERVPQASAGRPNTSAK
jgi:hypothetical protein